MYNQTGLYNQTLYNQTGQRDIFRSHYRFKFGR